MKVQKKKLSVFLLVSGISMLILIVGCGGDSVNKDTDPPKLQASAADELTDGSCDDMTGTWEVTEHISGCQLMPAFTRSLTFPVTQDGCDLTIHTFGGIFTKTLNNNSISLTGSYPENGGMITGTYTFLLNGDELSGSSTWSWTDGVLSCSGTSQLTGIRSDFTIGPDCEDVSGSWHTNETFESQACGVNGTSDLIFPITQNGCDIKVNTPAGAFNGTVADNQISWSGSFPDSGGTTETSVELTIMNNELTGSASWTWTGSIACAGTTQITGNRK